MLIKLMILFSQLINVVFLNGHQDVTVSARCYVNRRKPKWRTAYKAINRIAFWQEDHCKSSFETDISYARALVAFLDHKKANGEFW